MKHSKGFIKAMDTYDGISSKSITPTQTIRYNFGEMITSSFPHEEAVHLSRYYDSVGFYEITKQMRDVTLDNAILNNIPMLGLFFVEFDEILQ